MKWYLVDKLDTITTTAELHSSYGKVSAKAGDNITLGKINTSLKRTAKELKSDIKILQTHKVFNAINFIQRNRNLKRRVG